MHFMGKGCHVAACSPYYENAVACVSSSSVFYPPAAERFAPLVKVVLSRETQSTGWDRQMDAEALTQFQQVQHIIEDC